MAGARSALVMTAGRVELEQLAAVGTYDFHLDDKRTLQFGAGLLIGGTLRLQGRPYHLGPGLTASFGMSWLLVEPKGFVPFVMLSGSFSATAAANALSPYYAFDLRAGIAAGFVLFGRLTPYLAARLFGGPVFWNGMVGGDASHFQLGGGVLLGLPAGFDLSAECIPLGEQSVSVTVGHSF